MIVSLKKSSNRKSKLVLAGHYMAFKHRILFAIDLAANLGWIDSESRQTSFQSFFAPPSEVAVLFDSNLSRRPFLGQVVDLDLLLCTGFYLEHAVLFLCHIFTRRPMQDWAERCVLLWSATTSGRFHGNFISQWKQNLSSRPDIYKA